MKCSSIFAVLVTFSSAAYAREQFYRQSSSNHKIRRPDVFHTPSFFSQPFAGFEQVGPSHKGSSHNNEIVDSASESSELMPVEIIKNFYFHVAPEDHQPVQQITQKVMSGPPVKNYKVIFIKAPAEQRRTTNANVVHTKRDDEAVVYVLREKSEDIEIEKVSLQPDPGKFSTPDILFANPKINDKMENIRAKIEAHYGFLRQSHSPFNAELGRKINAMAEYRVTNNVGQSSKIHRKMFKSVRYTNTLQAAVR